MVLQCGVVKNTVGGMLLVILSHLTVFHHIMIQDARRAVQAESDAPMLLS